MTAARIAFVAAALLLVPRVTSAASREYAVTGVLVTVDRDHKTFTASCESVPGLMPAMTMPFSVREAGELAGLAPGMTVDFTLRVGDRESHAERVRVRRFETPGRDPTAAKRLQLMDRIAASSSGIRPLAVGDAVPEFALIDQARRRTALSQFSGTVVAINFVYTSCVLPDYCLRLANNFSAIQKRFRAQLGRDLVLLTVTFDPAHDTPEVLTAYARRWDADPAVWRFLTGAPADVRRVCRLFGVDAFVNEGFLDHSLHTAIIGRDGRLAANVEGNQFTPEQLGDLVQAQLARPHFK